MDVTHENEQSVDQEHRIQSLLEGILLSRTMKTIPRSLSFSVVGGNYLHQLVENLFSPEIRLPTWDLCRMRLYLSLI